MSGLKIILKNNASPGKTREISIGETLLSGRFFNHGLGRNATVSVRNADMEGGGTNRKKSSIDYDERDYISGNILIKAVEAYLKEKLPGVSKQGGKYVLNCGEDKHVEIFEELKNKINSKDFINELKGFDKELRDILKEIEEENPDHKDLARGIMKEAMVEATTKALKGEDFKLPDLLQERSKANKELEWSSGTIEKAESWAIRLASWLKRTFENLFQKKGLGEDTYRKCSLIDDYVSRNIGNSEDSKESGSLLSKAGNLLKEFYIRRVNENLEFLDYLSGKSVDRESGVYNSIRDMHEQILIDSNNQSSLAYKEADSKISARYGNYQNIFKQLNEQKIYQDLSTKAKKLPESSGPS